MATINRTTLLGDVKLWLPPTQGLSDEMILLINEQVISSVGDDDTYYKEIQCKCIKACARKLMADYAVSGANLKREKTMYVEAEYYNLNSNPWESFYNSVESDICPLFGYVTPKTATGSLVSTIEYNNKLTEDFTLDCGC